MDLGLKGKVALVTGGSEGIGEATAKAFAHEGAKVAICARREEPLKQVAAAIAAAGGECLALSADVRRAEDIERFVGAAHERFGRIDALVNNAGMAAANPFESITDEAWIDDLDLKVFAAIRTCRLVIPMLRAQGGGAIVNVTQITGKQPGAASYPSSMSRAAGIALTKALPHAPASGRAAGGGIRAHGQKRPARPPRRLGGSGGPDHVPLLRPGALHHRRCDQLRRRHVERPVAGGYPRLRQFGP